jgi:hypothetical protein
LCAVRRADGLIELLDGLAVVRDVVEGARGNLATKERGETLGQAIVGLGDDRPESGGQRILGRGELDGDDRQAEHERLEDDHGLTFVVA